MLLFQLKNNLLKKKTRTLFCIINSLVCIDALVERKLAKAHNAYEATSILILLQGYLDKASDTIQMPRVRASEIFSDIIKKLPFKIRITTKDKALGMLIDSILNPSGQTQIATSTCRLCTNADNPGVLTNCTELHSRGDCDERIVFGLSYKELCIGFKIDPNILDLNKVLYKNDLPDYIKVMENIIDKAAEAMKSQAQDIFLMIYEEHKND